MGNRGNKPKFSKVLKAAPAFLMALAAPAAASTPAQPTPHVSSRPASSRTRSKRAFVLEQDVTEKKQSQRKAAFSAFGKSRINNSKAEVKTESGDVLSFLNSNDLLSSKDLKKASISGDRKMKGSKQFAAVPTTTAGTFSAFLTGPPSAIGCGVVYHAPYFNSSTLYKTSRSNSISLTTTFFIYSWRTAGTTFTGSPPSYCTTSTYPWAYSLNPTTAFASGVNAPLVVVPAVANLNGTLAYTPGAPKNLGFAGYAITDADSARPGHAWTATINLTVADGSPGAIWEPGYIQGAWRWTGPGAGTYKITMNSLANLMTRLNNLSFIPVPGSTSNATVTVAITDNNGSTLNGTINLVAGSNAPVGVDGGGGGCAISKDGSGNNGMLAILASLGLLQLFRRGRLRLGYWWDMLKAKID